MTVSSLSFLLILEVISDQFDCQFINGIGANALQGGALGSACLANNPQCMTPNSVCLSNICQCQLGFAASNGACRASTLLAGCPSDTIPYINPATQTTLSCQTTPDTCPVGYLCTRNVPANAFVCCGKTSDSCPPGSNPGYNPSTGQVQLCSPNFSQGCSAGFQCLSHNNRYACCSPTNQFFYCPPPSQPSIDPLTSQIRQCSLTNAACPYGYNCIFYQNAYSCCSQTFTNNIGNCPAGRSPYLNPGTGTVQYCSPQNPLCPLGYACESAGTNFLCCQTNVVPYASGVCIIGTSPYIEPGTGGFRSCTASSAVCPGGYICNLQSGICCTTRTGLILETNLFCPNGQQAYVSAITGQPQLCNSTPLGCPAGYTCQFSSSAFICCTSPRPLGQTCPNGAAAYITSTTGQLLSCTLPGTQSNCPFGYLCNAVTGQPLCCPSGGSPSLSCPSGTMMFMNPSTALPQGCNPTLSSCPAPYVCTFSAGAYVCCSVTATASCPAGMQPYATSGGLPQTCSIQFSNCPPSYSCQYSSTSQSYICCGQPVGLSVYCPPGSRTQPMQSGGTQACSAQQQNVCVFGFFCYYPSAVTGIGYCCSSNTQNSVCPSGTRPFLNSITQTAVPCNPTQPTSCAPLYACIFSQVFNSGYCCSATARDDSGLPDGNTSQAMNQILVTGRPASTRPVAAAAIAATSPEQQPKQQLVELTVNPLEMVGKHLQLPCRFTPDGAPICFIEDSFCGVEGRCVCKAGFIEVEGQCLQQEIGESLRGLIWQFLKPVSALLSNQPVIEDSQRDDDPYLTAAVTHGSASYYMVLPEGKKTNSSDSFAFKLLDVLWRIAPNSKKR